MKSDFWCLTNQAGYFPEIVDGKRLFVLPRLEIVSSRIKVLVSMGLWIYMNLEQMF